MEYMVQFAAVAGTLGLLWFTLHALRRLRQGESPRGRVEVQQRISIANGCQLVVVHWDGRELLLATGNQPCTLVASKPVVEVLAPAEASSAWAR